MILCPECESDLDIDEDEVEEGEVVSCAECGTRAAEFDGDAKKFCDLIRSETGCEKLGDFTILRTLQNVRRDH